LLKTIKQPHMFPNTTKERKELSAL